MLRRAAACCVGGAGTAQQLLCCASFSQIMSVLGAPKNCSAFVSADMCTKCCHCAACRRVCTDKCSHLTAKRHVCACMMDKQPAMKEAACVAFVMLGCSAAAFDCDASWPDFAPFDATGYRYRLPYYSLQVLSSSENSYKLRVSGSSPAARFCCDRHRRS